VPAVYPRRDVLAERTRVSASLLSAEPATTAELGRQLRELRASPFGRWLSPPAAGPAAEIDLRGAVAARAVVLFRVGGAGPAESPAMLTRLVCEDLLAAGEALSGIGVDGDGIVWLTECAWLPRRSVTDLIARGRGTGLPVLAATASAHVAPDLAGLANVLVAHRMDDAAAGRRLAAVAAAPGQRPDPGPDADAAPEPVADTADLSALRDGEFLLAVKNPRRLVPRARAVRARIRPLARGGRPAPGEQRAWEGT